MKKLSHTDRNGNARMVDVGEKPASRRMARAEGHISLSPETIGLIQGNLLKKGDVLTVAEIAGIQAIKQTAHLIPLCHTLVIEKAAVKVSLTNSGAVAVSEVHCTGKTGVEMEALTGVSIALLTIYDMCKAVDKNMSVNNICLLEKTKKET
ncbi:MAG: cyclic pyranopterin monophosphate synthase MoaC [Bacteroidales bacterium]|nr:cyclic pyranopterin monophosphate synthase MoaC [Bacteroidales bacterium]